MRGRRALILILVVAMVVVPAATVVVADTRGEPHLSAELPDNRVEAGEVTALELQISNTATVESGSRNPTDIQRATAARGVRVSLRSGDAPIQVRTNARRLGQIPDGGVASVPFEVVVDEDAEPGRYRVPVDVEYTYTELIDDRDRFRDEDTVDETLYVGVRVVPAADFAVVETTTEAAIGANGSIRMAVENTGNAPAREATLSVQSTSGSLTFGESPTAETYVGDWPAGERRNFTFSASVAGDVEPRSIALGASVRYEDEDGVPQNASLTTGARPAEEQSFSLAETDGSLRVDSEGNLTGTIRNGGPVAADNAVLVLEDPGSNVDATEREFALGDLEPNESTSFGYEIEISDSARAGPRQFTYRVRYDDANGVTTRSDPLYARYDVGPSQQVFDVETNATVGAGGSTQLRVQLTNNRDVPVSDVSAKLFADSPISVSDDEAFVDTIEPGGTETLTFAIGAAGSATPKVYPVSLDFQYDEPDGDTKLSDTYRVPVEVTESEGGGFLGLLLGPGGLLVFLAVGGVAGVVLFRRSRSA
ncbi:COG1361 S-layer family protein [Salinirubellus sp. GCM10025818]|uniref:COG1361 S-layer family protein n=1 Tax=Salinirubellus TaxID=2162630 RepID=UPI0030CE7F5C